MAAEAIAKIRRKNSYQMPDCVPTLLALLQRAQRGKTAVHK